MSFTLFDGIVLGIFAILAVLIIRGVVKDLGEEEGCKGCDGICTRNGGYCPRKKEHRVKPDMVMRRRKAETAEGARNQVIAVACDKYGTVTDYERAGYFMLYQLTKRGITDKHLNSVGKADADTKLEVLKMHRVDTCLAAGIEESHEDAMREKKVNFIRTAEFAPDTAVDIAFRDVLEAPQEGRAFLDIMAQQMKDAFKSYPGHPIATLVNYVGTAILFVTLVIIIIFMIQILLRVNISVAEDVVPIAAFIQMAGYFIVCFSEKLTAKKKK